MQRHLRWRRLFLLLAFTAIGGLSVTAAPGHAPDRARAAPGLADICSAGQDVPAAPGTPETRCAKAAPCCAAAAAAGAPVVLLVVPESTRGFAAAPAGHPVAASDRWRWQARAPPLRTAPSIR